MGFAYQGTRIQAMFTPRGYSCIWPIRGYPTGQSMVFVLSVIIRAYNQNASDIT